MPNQSGEPTAMQWAAASDCYSASGQSFAGGRIGFGTRYAGNNEVDDVTVRSWNGVSSAFDIVELAETFTVDATSSLGKETLAHDANGNLTYDGSLRYAYDAWNRLVKVAHAYRDSGGTVQVGHAFDVMSCDAQGRRGERKKAGQVQLFWVRTTCLPSQARSERTPYFLFDFAMFGGMMGQGCVRRVIRADGEGEPEVGGDHIDGRRFVSFDVGSSVVSRSVTRRLSCGSAGCPAWLS